MDSTKIKDWLEVVGMFGVIASLIFVAMEMRQSQKIAVANINSQRADTSIQLLSDMAANREFLSAFTKVRSGDEAALTESEANVANFYFMAFNTRYADIYWQYVNGFVPESRWLAVRAAWKRQLSTDEIYRSFTESEDSQFSEQVWQVIEQMLSEIDAAK
jgi:hypothetical protein